MTLPAFVLAAAVLALTPSPGLAYVVARTVAGGRAEGLASCLGAALGGLVHVLAAALGVSLLIARSAVAFAVLKYVGAAVLIGLGLQMLLGRGRATRAAEAVKGTPLMAQGARRAFVQGVVVETLNVKTALFFLAFLPQFIEPGEPLVPQWLLLGGFCVALNTSVDILAVLAADRLLASGGLRDARARWLNRVSGSILVALGGWLALARRQA